MGRKKLFAVLLLAFIGCAFEKENKEQYIRQVKKNAIQNIFDKGFKEYSSGNLKDAITSFQDVIEQTKPDNVFHLLSLFFIGRIYESNRKFDEAISYYNRVLDIAPDFLETHYRLAKIYEYLGKHKLAMKHYSKASSRFPEFYQAKADEAFFYYNYVGWYAKAYELYRDIIKVNPRDPEANYILGDILYINGNKKLGVYYFSRYLSYDKRPQNGFWRYRALKAVYDSLVEKGDNERAKVYAKWMKKVDPGGIYARIFSGGECSYYETGPAVAYKEKPKEVKKVEEKIKTGKIKEAKKELEKYLKERPQDPEALKLMAKIAEKEGKEEEVTKYLKKAVELNRKDIDAMYELGVEYFDQLDYDRAIEQFNKVITEDPKHADAYYNLACIYAIKGNNDLALEYLEKAIQNGFTDFDYIMNDPDLETLQDDVRFMPLIEKYKKMYGK